MNKPCITFSSLILGFFVKALTNFFILLQGLCNFNLLYGIYLLPFFLTAIPNKKKPTAHLKHSIKRLAPEVHEEGKNKIFQRLTIVLSSEWFTVNIHLHRTSQTFRYTNLYRQYELLNPNSCFRSKINCGRHPQFIPNLFSLFFHLTDLAVRLAA